MASDKEQSKPTEQSKGESAKPASILTRPANILIVRREPSQTIKTLQITEGIVRNMRKELAEKGTPLDTDEIRVSWMMGTMVNVLTHVVPGPAQNPHKHMITNEITTVLAGQVEVWGGDEIYDPDGEQVWQTVNEGQAVTFEPGKFHNMRASAYQGYNAINYPHVGPAVTAVTITTKYLPPYVHDQKEVALLIDHDWFGADYVHTNNGPLMRAAKSIQDEFWTLIDRYQLLRGNLRTE